jgi:subtilisin family serine protease
MAGARRKRGDSSSSERVWADIEAKEETPKLRDDAGKLSVLVEMVSMPGASAMVASAALREETLGGLELDEEFQPVPLGGGTLEAALGLGVAGTPTYVVRAKVDDESAMAELRKRPDVVEVWEDTPIAPYQTCPIPPCDCSPGTPKGTMADVANYLGVSQVWAAGFRGTGMVVGIVDGGITAQGRPVKTGETTRRIPRVIGGWPTADWGTEASRWSEHGNMTSTDVLGMAPDAQIYDLRISGAPDIPSTISRALQAFQWAIDQHKVNGTPHILSNSWGIFQESWDTTYARNPNHPFTRKVVEALDEGIIVLFAAGNCGGTCPDGRCGADNGPGRSIWGANSHPRVMTVGAVNKNEEFVGYSSQGPGALDPNKPDFCSVTHFTGYFTSDSGTSAATPILAGAVALLKQAVPGATQDGIKAALKATAKDIGPAGFDQHSGSGIVRIKAAFDRLRLSLPPSKLIVRCPSIVRPACPSVLRPCPSVPIVKCPSRVRPCPTSPIICRPSVLVRCPSELVRCPSATIVCPTTPITCDLIPSRTVPCPSQLACPSSTVCRPGGPGGGQEAWGYGGEDELYGAYDTGYEQWYGVDEMDELGGEGGYDPAGDYWYGGW